MWEVLKKAVSTCLMLLGLTGLVDNVVVWQGFLGEIVTYYTWTRDFVFGFLPFEVPNWIKDYLIIGAAFASSWVSLLFKTDLDRNEPGNRPIRVWDLTKLVISNSLLWPLVVGFIILFALLPKITVTVNDPPLRQLEVTRNVMRKLSRELLWSAVVFLGALFVFSDAFLRLSGG